MDILIHTNYSIGERVWVEDKDNEGEVCIGFITGIRYNLYRNSIERLTYEVQVDGSTRSIYVPARLTHRATEEVNPETLHYYPPRKTKKDTETNKPKQTLFQKLFRYGKTNETSAAD